VASKWLARIKPENVLLADGVWKITDFGIAKDTGHVMTRRTFLGAGTSTALRRSS
jgi:serine/threonine protein kinase